MILWLKTLVVNIFSQNVDVFFIFSHLSSFRRVFYLLQDEKWRKMLTFFGKMSISNVLSHKIVILYSIPGVNPIKLFWLKLHQNWCDLRLNLACWVCFWCNWCQNWLYRIDPWCHDVQTSEEFYIGFCG